MLKKHKDLIEFSKLRSSLNNIVFGEKYIDFYGTANFVNKTTNDAGVLTLTERKKRDNAKSYAVEGLVKNAKGEERFQIFGKWNEAISIRDCKTKQETQVWKANKTEVLEKKTYFFDKTT